MQRDDDGDRRAVSGAMTRRSALLAATAALATACTGDDPRSRAIRMLYRQATGREQESPLTREQIEQKPFAMIEVRIGRTTLAILVLNRREGPDLYWVAANRSLLVTRANRIVRTVGLPVDIVYTHFIAADPVATGLHRLTGPFDLQRVVDYNSSERYGRVIKSTFEVMGDDPIEIVDLKYPTRLIRERCIMDVEDWRFENFYWIDPATGNVWQSVQHISKDFPPLRIRVLKPPAANV